MALLHSHEIPLGTKAQDFCLQSVDDKTYGLVDVAGPKGLLVAFICNHCPYVKAIEDRLIKLGHDLLAQGVGVVAICSNDAQNYPDDDKAHLKQRWLEKKYGIPYVLDQTQEVARAYGAVCTPDLYVFDSALKLFYHGRLDDNWRDAHAVLSHDLRDAAQAMLLGSPPPKEQIPSMGCSIKWRVTT